MVAKSVTEHSHSYYFKMLMAKFLLCVRVTFKVYSDYCGKGTLEHITAHARAET